MPVDALRVESNVGPKRGLQQAIITEAQGLRHLFHTLNYKGGYPSSGEAI